MSKCKEITTRKRWCSGQVLLESARCRWHQDGPTFNATSDDYKAADYWQNEVERATALGVSNASRGSAWRRRGTSS